MKKKSHMGWSWILMVAFLALSVLDYRFGIGALICMILPLVQSLRGNGKIHCSHYCPRGSLFGKFLSKISFRNSLPRFMQTILFRNIMLGTMITLMTVSIMHDHSSLAAIGFILFRFVVATSIAGILLGIFYQPRSWCQVCPMGHLSGVVAQIKRDNAA